MAPILAAQSGPVGSAGLLTVVQPFFPVAVAIFGLSGIVWFIWLGVTMLRGLPAPGVRAVVAEAAVTP